MPSIAENERKALRHHAGKRIDGEGDARRARWLKTIEMRSRMGGLYGTLSIEVSWQVGLWSGALLTSHRMSLENHLDPLKPPRALLPEYQRQPRTYILLPMVIRAMADERGEYTEWCSIYSLRPKREE
ncbi:BZ3500_MvSof-1268-A1-R1_Chr2-2g04924 [Microbotryum saponariae]|uniref:BZ3500_MvSof-1268-A1-R1_Chr2-2g04924 protein n=1 Tax=Microbotryum saponariae TaxID=289078 RepID=A0A2X0K893_9BASI|nr:BZ3500_MvSof-1268-A1-R1_Chr2-2g04924 [Microbotryum saponariae]SDA00490.1 BZ3501_MvSof-1269-A2-R1_Chr2-2g04598 [Microbotryum saponariae]